MDRQTIKTHGRASNAACTSDRSHFQPAPLHFRSQNLTQPQQVGGRKKSVRFKSEPVHGPPVREHDTHPVRRSDHRIQIPSWCPPACHFTDARIVGRVPESAATAPIVFCTSVAGPAIPVDNGCPDSSTRACSSSPLTHSAGTAYRHGWSLRRCCRQSPRDGEFSQVCFNGATWPAKCQTVSMWDLPWIENFD